MLISRNPAVTLELCYVWQKLQPSNIDPVKETEYVVRGGHNHRITRDKKGNIINLPTPRHDVTETKRGRASTTNRTADGAMIGRVLAAASNQAPACANLLQFLYDPECPPTTFLAVESWAKVQMEVMFDEKLHGSRRAINASALVWPLLLDFSQRIRCGMDRYTEAQLCQYMGFVNTRDANYARDYRHLVGDFMLQLQDAQVLALDPVCRVIDRMFWEPPAAYVTAVNCLATPVLPRPPAPQQRPLVMPFGTTLTLKRADA